MAREANPNKRLSASKYINTIKAIKVKYEAKYQAVCSVTEAFKKVVVEERNAAASDGNKYF
ncbi:MAG: hypothetical protein K0U24_02420 [Gammaproteobacteria bacterium]|nr:hypothetical protein [Gammaproteobacteria bacterium]MCH9716951.1 hypothetical protein [Gammaproteobacteria bacterium]MCH9763076.1 hypothetical protein [Gammaproteobacteria bacterium]